MKRQLSNSKLGLFILALSFLLWQPGAKADCNTCLCGYPYVSTNRLTSIAFNESEILRGFNTNLVNLNDTIRVWYNDEHAMLLGIRRVIIKTKTGSTTNNYPVAPLPASPSGVAYPAVGSLATSGDQAGTDITNRPAFPCLFITDITTNPASTSGDWQWGGVPIPPHAVFGSWKAAVRTIDKTRTPAVVTIATDADPAKNNWNLAGGDPAPAGLANEGYGAEVRWNISELGLLPGHSYRLYFMVHDGDQNQIGGDAGQGCINVVVVSAAGPDSQTACPGSTVTLSTTVFGISTYNLQWLKNGQVITGKTNQTLTLNNVSQADAGTYTARISSTCGSVTNNATLAINSPLQVITPPASQVVCRGANASFTVNATGTGLTYQWYKNSTLLDGQTGASLTLNAVSATDAATYSVVMSAACGNPMATSASLTVNDSTPTIVPPADVTLECPANINPSNTGTAFAMDTCGSVSVAFSDAVSSTCGGGKVITRTWIATDTYGHSAQAAQKITVRDTTAPSITAPADVVLPFTSGIDSGITGAATAQDGCSSVTVASSDAVNIRGDGSQVITRTWVATDACDNKASAVQTITLDRPAALVLPVQTDIVLSNSSTLLVTNTASNPNVPANPITYQLLDPPAGATIDGSGIITWTPTLSQSPSTNLVTTVVTTTVVSAAGTSTIGSTNSFTVVVTGPYDNLDMLVDSDGDGLTNLVEYAVGGDPLNPTDGDAGLHIFITQDNGNHYLAMQFKRRTNAAALQLQYLPEVSADKLTWYSDAAHVLGLSVTPLDSTFDWVTVRDTTPITAPAARFIRLHVILAGQESASPVWIGSDTVLQANRLTFFSQRMVRPIVSAGTVTGVSASSLTVNDPLSNNQFGTNGTPAYVEFDNGAMVDISDTSANNVAVSANAAGVCSAGTRYRIRPQFTVASLFGTNNETGLVAGGNPVQADNILLFLPESQSMLTLFYYSNPSFTSWQGWVRADTFTPAADLVVYPEQGVMVKRIVATDANLYLCGPVKTGVTLAPIQPGNNLVGTLKSLSNMPLSALNLYTGDPTTGFAAGQKPRDGDNLLLVAPDGSLATYFYYYQAGVYSGWVNANGFTLANDVQIPAGSAFYIKRQVPGGFTWTIPAE